MGVVFIGDRATGKTSLVMGLIKPDPTSPISINLLNQTYENLKKILRFNETAQTYEGTGGIVDPLRGYWNQFLEVNVKLPAGPRTFSLEWIDTPGEAWSQSWPATNPDQWQEILLRVQQSQGIVLILPPYREMPGLKPDAALQFPTETQWCKRFRRWVDFFHYQCPQAKHIVICLNKADLFCNLQKQALELAYQPVASRRNWHERNIYVSQRYFSPVQADLTRLERQNQAFVRCFITSIYNRPLLELPWIYLASHLA